jgi:phosphoglycerol transferase MdoB-like AlkP superfamily enzyme
MMINFNDPDYVHWGHLSHYTRGIAIIDESIQRLVEVTDADPFYAGRTIFAIVPDCGRDDNRLMHVPCQHHFNSPSSRKIFAMLAGPGIEQGVVVDKTVEQIAMAPTIGRLMGLATTHTQGDVLKEALA